MNHDSEYQGHVPLGTKIGNFRIIRLLGHGGMGEVYEANDLTLRRRVALKVPFENGLDELACERFLKEARNVALIDHPNVVAIYAAGEQRSTKYLAMQYVEGEDLQKIMQKRGSALPCYPTLKIIRLAALGMHAIHEHGLIHRDIKPSNIMLSSHSNVLVMDFGVVRDAGSDLTSFGHVLGTPPYMSPEQCRGDQLDRRTDIYSLGATMYCLLTGRQPFDGATLSVIQRIGSGELPAPIREINPGVPRDIARVVEKAMAIRPQDRFSDSGTMYEVIREMREDYRISKRRDSPRADSAIDYFADMERFLGENSDEESPPSAVHRLRKYVGRKSARIFVPLAVAAVFVSFIAGVWIGWIWAKS